MMARLTSALLLLVHVLIATAFLVFATGFFPYKPFIPGHATYAMAPAVAEPVPAPFDKVIFMVVDALRRYLFIVDA